MYLLYLDESGSHVGSPALVLAGVAVHEQDAWSMQLDLHGVLRSRLPQGLNPADFELHANEIKSPVKTIRGKKVRSAWSQVPISTRFDVMRATYQLLATFRGCDPRYPHALFGAVVDPQYADREKRAYEEVLHKFDEMLNRQAIQSGVHQRGIVIHDRRLLLERDVQTWTEAWRHAAGRIGKLTHFTDVPMFADSKASRLIQAADFVAWGLYRYYGDARDESWIRPAWGRFDNANGQMHGLIHVSPAFVDGTCGCPPCVSRRPLLPIPPVALC